MNKTAVIVSFTIIITYTHAVACISPDACELTTSRGSTPQTKRRKKAKLKTRSTSHPGLKVSELIKLLLSLRFLASIGFLCIQLFCCRQTIIIFLSLSFSYSSNRVLLMHASYGWPGGFVMTALHTSFAATATPFRLCFRTKD